MRNSWVVQSLIAAGWAPVLVLLVHVVATKALNLYARFPDFDIPMHLAGGFAIAFFFHTAAKLAVRHHVLGPYHRLTHVALVFSYTCVAAVFWEFAEFLADHFFGGRAQNGDLNDTLLDMLLGLVGGSALLLVMWLAGRIPAK